MLDLTNEDPDQGTADNEDIKDPHNYLSFHIPAILSGMGVWLDWPPKAQDIRRGRALRRMSASHVLLSAT
ncbi:hypothetical protein EMCG_06037 [[Emmonsia] crescens]|uniref:Uncharacterized protein n=1 Tax=[Emmonsia] crescens TaxID=73230 RepID=A0A0G2JBY3_9EURO|nr:hypothetical protein EMCG_06037 [Emmonsia crescens UAMH 3008]